ncbi:MAG: hypothetical protein BroJett006_25790 [Betaproteobacteria bacterium]|jgi:hypothetical protein|nr:MAG: hypothetical protein BroJett006_25790 [Betaproteobacteria bacterium]
MVQALLIQRMRQCAHDVLLADQGGEGTGAPLAREDLIAHGRILSEGAKGKMEGGEPDPRHLQIMAVAASFRT